MDKYHLWLHKYHRASFIWSLLHKFGWKVQTSSCPALWFGYMMSVRAVGRKMLLKPPYKQISSEPDPHTKFTDGVSFEAWFLSANKRIYNWPGSGNSSPAPSYFHLLRFSSISALLHGTALLPAIQEKWQEPIRIEKICYCHCCFWTCHLERWYPAGSSAISERSLGQELHVAVPECIGLVRQFLGTKQGWPATGLLPFRTHITAAHQETSDAPGLIWSPWE